MSQVQCYDPVTNRWTYVTSCPFSQRSLSAVSLNGCIYVTGGLLDEMFCYAPSTDVWSSVTVLPVKLVRKINVEVNPLTHTQCNV